MIINWLIALGAWWRDDETPWCSTFVAHCCRTAGRDLPKHWYRAKGWLETGTRLSKSAYGCIVVFERQGGGHVGFVVGQDRQGNLMVLGGNQGDAVNI
ncbi:TIGR02594 family protein, partial [Eikenella sp. NML03-A-027]|uniref:TIGR02594 family protein n=1 Tax=Eikenella sp. NML03-A-027 TaxID=1795828 RepID=UPI0012E93F9D